MTLVYVFSWMRPRNPIFQGAASGETGVLWCRFEIKKEIPEFRE
jgi:hypothetical protein